MIVNSFGNVTSETSDSEPLSALRLRSFSPSIQFERLFSVF